MPPQVRYLLAVERCVPEALRELALVGEDEAAFNQWTRQYGFTDLWARRNARSQAALFQSVPGLTRRWHFMTPDFRWVPVCIWEADRETLQAFTARARREQRALRTRVPNGERHFEWLALYHAGRWTLRQIAERYQDADGLTDSTISEAIRDTAHLVSVTVRAGLRGPRRRNFGRINH